MMASNRVLSEKIASMIDLDKVLEPNPATTDFNF